MITNKLQELRGETLKTLYKVLDSIFPETSYDIKIRLPNFHIQKRDTFIRIENKYYIGFFDDEIITSTSKQVIKNLSTDELVNLLVETETYFKIQRTKEVNTSNPIEEINEEPHLEEPITNEA